MRPYTKAVYIWKLSDAAIAQLQPGQWVHTGDESQKGRFYGINATGGTTVVAWNSRVPAGAKRKPYLAAYASYGRQVRERAA